MFPRRECSQSVKTFHVSFSSVHLQFCTSATRLMLLELLFKLCVNCMSKSSHIKLLGDFQQSQQTYVVSMTMNKNITCLKTIVEPCRSAIYFDFFVIRVLWLFKYGLFYYFMKMLFMSYRHLTAPGSSVQSSARVTVSCRFPSGFLTLSKNMHIGRLPMLS